MIICFEIYIRLKTFSGNDVGKGSPVYKFGASIKQNENICHMPVFVSSEKHCELKYNFILNYVSSLLEIAHKVYYIYSIMSVSGYVLFSIISSQWLVIDRHGFTIKIGVDYLKLSNFILIEKST